MRPRMFDSVFARLGRFCAGHPLEVIVITVTLTACALNVELGLAHFYHQHRPTVYHHHSHHQGSYLHFDSGLASTGAGGITTSGHHHTNNNNNNHCRQHRCGNEVKTLISELVDIVAADVILMTIFRCLAILFSYNQFHNILNIGSRWVTAIAGIFTVFSSIIFTWSILHFGRYDVTDLKDALFFFLLLIDLNKAGLLAQFALNSKNHDEVRANIARGMSLIGPSITLDTMVEFLLIGIGSLSGVRRLEMLCSYACLGVIVNYVIFMTIYPAFLSLILELSRVSNHEFIVPYCNLPGGPEDQQQHEGQQQKSNPIVEKLKLIMIAGLFVVHAHSRWPFRYGDQDDSIHESIAPGDPSIILTNRNKTEAPPDLKGYLMNWLSVSADNVVILIVLIALAVKFLFFETRNDFVKQLRFKEQFDELELEKKRRQASFREQQEREQHQHQELNAESTSNPRFEAYKLAVQQIQLEQKKRTNSEQSAGAVEEDDMDGKLRRRFSSMTLPGVTTKPPVFPLAGMGEDWVEVEGNLHVELVDKEVQTDSKNYSPTSSSIESLSMEEHQTRSVEESLAVYKSELGAAALTDEEVILLVKHKYIQSYQLEKAVGSMERGVGIRRLILGSAGNFTEGLIDLPYQDYDYSKVLGSCCENVIGYVPVPVGVAGPLFLDGELVYVPMATTEGCLVASTNRGSRSLMGCGVTSRVVADGMTRGPVVRFPSVVRASEAMSWMQQLDNFQKMKSSFDETSRFARLTRIHVRIAGRHLFIRFVAKTGDAMGMNMLSKATEKSLHSVQERFTDMEILSLSGNFCTDKKPAAVNWIEGRGKSVVCEAIVPGEVVQTVLKTTTHALVDVNISKNMIGSAVAGSIGGFNAHAANIVTAIFIATGQDPAQNVGSSNCMTLMEPWGPDGQDLYVSCTMPSIEIGTIGGGTGLPAQGACLAMLGVKGAHAEEPGQNASKLARIVCATVLAGELSLMAALTAGHLVKSHLRHNRSSTSVGNPVPTPTPRLEQGVSLKVPNVMPMQSNGLADRET